MCYNSSYVKHISYTVYSCSAQRNGIKVIHKNSMGYQSCVTKSTGCTLSLTLSTPQSFFLS